MRSLLGHWREIASITALFAGLSSLVIGSCSLNRSYQTSKILQDVTTQLNIVETRTENVEASSTYSWYSWILFTTKGPDFIKERQVQAASSKPPYVEPLTSTEFKTTLEGRNLLTTEQMQRVISLIEKDKSTLESQVILELGIEKLYLQAKADKVSIDIIIGVVASYAQEQKALLKEKP